SIWQLVVLEVTDPGGVNLFSHGSLLLDERNRDAAGLSDGFCPWTIELNLYTCSVSSGHSDGVS
ncbi:MAG: hypothetical protein ACI8RZ_007886, partial [Myxococcota bacterium]